MAYFFTESRETSCKDFKQQVGRADGWRSDSSPLCLAGPCRLEGRQKECGKVQLRKEGSKSRGLAKEKKEVV